MNPLNEFIIVTASKTGPHIGLFLRDGVVIRGTAQYMVGWDRAEVIRRTSIKAWKIIDKIVDLSPFA